MTGPRVSACLIVRDEEEHLPECLALPQWREPDQVDARRQAMSRIPAVELQDFAPQHLYSQLEYAEARGSVIDHRGTTAQAMQEYLKLENAQLQPTAAEVTSADNRDQYRIGIAQIYASLKGFDDFGETKEHIRGFLAIAMKRAGTPQLAAINIRSIDIAPVESFEELRDLLGASLAQGAADGLGKAVGTDVSDLGWSFEFKSDGTTTTAQFGAMESTQLATILQYEDGDYPPNMLFLSLAAVHRPTDAGRRDSLEWWEQAIDENRRTAAGIGDWVRETIR